MYLVPQPVIGSGLQGPIIRRSRRSARKLSRLGDLAPGWTYQNSCGNPDLVGAAGRTLPSPLDAFAQAVSSSGADQALNPRDFNSCAWYTQALQCVQSGNVPLTWFSPACAGAVSSNPDLSLTQAAGKLAAAGITAGASIYAGATGVTTASVLAAPATLGVSLAIAAVVAIVSLIFSHHAAAVQEEQQAGCSGLAAVNNTMAVLQEGVASGQIAPADAATALSTMWTAYRNFLSQTGVWGTSPYCNANCEMSIIVQAMVIYWQAQFGAMSAPAPAAVTPSSPTAIVSANPISDVTNEIATVAASTGLPSWLFWAAGLFAVYEFVA